MHRLATILHVTDDDRRRQTTDASVPIARPLVRSANENIVNAADRVRLSGRIILF